MPGNFEIVQLLADRLRGRPLRPPVAAIFHDIYILDHHPLELYEQYKAYQEAGCIYFFSPQEILASSSAARNNDKKRRPMRTAIHGGVWKPCGGGKYLKSSGVTGKTVTMVFYEPRRCGTVKKYFKTNWGLHEFTVLVEPNKFSKMAVYRLYKMKTGWAKGGNRQPQANGAHYHHVPAAVVPVVDHHAPSSSAAGSSSATGQALSTPSLQQQKKQLMSIDQIQYAATKNWKCSFQFAASSSEQGIIIVPSGEQKSRTTASTEHFPLPKQIQGCDEAPSQPQLLLPVVGDEDYMFAMLNGDEVADGPAADEILDTFNDLSLLDGSDEIAFSMEELTGTKDPSSRDGNNLFAGGKQQDI